ncbi:hypothetical protein [Luteimonas fraxinea]|uniref:KAP NTPase domain-containing protein n=1 Tax=Luteimonas fraxinea TaxID=2901869 RepID=A0ABS8UD71_9GAMM|nr:hypothetical protein [Luteimonas fraxinea]MCD9096664.1 hypothetical protein [Luteimonas fraxinea]MCD9126034.1 hypothetical protein [Luteimonas fraxinea]
MSIEARLVSFLSSKEAGAIVLQGKWGTGKTHFWRHTIMAPVLAKPWKKRYSYVSLFGIESLAELKSALAIATDEFDQDARREKRKSAKILWLWWRLWAWLGDLLDFIPTFGEKLSAVFRRASFYLVRDRIICFDDIERRSEGMQLRDFLGLVSYLVDQRGCRVVVILNAGQLGDGQPAWDAYKEKVFDGEITFAPDLEQTISLGLHGSVDEPWHQTVSASLKELGVSNIRLVHRTARAVRLAMEATATTPLQDETVERIARVVPLLVYSAHGQGENAPPMDMITREGAYSFTFTLLGDDETRTPQEKAWQEALRTYGTSVDTTLDRALLSLVRAGYADREQLAQAIVEFEADRESRSLLEDYQKAWRTFHDTVAENGEEIVAAFERTWPQVSANARADETQSIARTMRLLGRQELATCFIDTWAAQQIDRPDALDMRTIQSYTQVDDPELLAAIERAREAAEPPLTLHDAFDRWLADTRGIDERAISTFAAASPAEIVELLDGVRDKRLVGALRRVMALDGNPGYPLWVSTVDNFASAFRQIASRSPLAAYRVKSWVGIEPASPERE